MKNIILVSFLITAIVIMNTRSIAQNLQSREIDSIEQAIIQYMDWYDLPGLSIGLIKNGEIFYTKGFGIKCIETNEPVTKNTIFSTASVTKLFVGIAIMQLYEEKKIDLNDNVSKYLPYFERN